LRRQNLDKADREAREQGFFLCLLFFGKVKIAWLGFANPGKNKRMRKTNG